MHSDCVLPIYVVCDTSLSMLDHIDTVLESLAALHRVVSADPATVDGTRLCLIGFSESPEVLLPLRTLSEAPKISRLAIRAGTNFGAAFAFLRDTIAADVLMLQARSLRVYRPVVFFLSDGQPTDPATWPVAFAALVDQSWAARPRIVAIGVGDVDAATMGRIGTFRTYLGQDGVSPVAGIHDLSICGLHVGETLSTARPEVRGAAVGDSLIRPRCGGPDDDYSHGTGQRVEDPAQGSRSTGESDR